MREKIEQILEDIRPSLMAEGGDVELVDVANDVVKIKFLGACLGYPMAGLTLQRVVAQAIKQQAPAIKEVIAV